MTTQRDPKLDLAKAVLICLVVLGHFVEAFDGRWRTDAGAGLRAIYMLHMPAFVFLAGITARARGTLSKVVQWLTLLAVFSAIYLAIDAVVDRVNRAATWNQPYWILWFLLALAVWQAVMPLIERFPRTAVCVSLVIGLGLATIDDVGYPFSLGRIGVFFPFFVLGAVYGKHFLAAIDRLPGAARAGLVALAGCGALFVATQKFSPFWLYGSRSYDGLNVSNLEGVATRGILIVFALLGLAALWAVLPRREGWFTAPGKRSLAIYLLHGIPVTLCTGLLRDVADLPAGVPKAFLLAVLLTALTVAVFSSPVFDRAIRAVGSVIARYLVPKRSGTGAHAQRSSAAR